MKKDFNDAIRNPARAFADPDLARSDPVLGATGRPHPYPGDSSDVYQLCGADDRLWAVKCFTNPSPTLAHRYAHISEALRQAALPVTVACEFLEAGIQVNGQRCPVLKMDWVEGLPLNQVARERANSPAVMENLFRRWVELCRELRQAGMAHGDLQHAHALLIPGSWPGAYTLKLIDYDAVYLPALADTPSDEIGHANYQHPARVWEATYSADLDRFPHLVIATALKALAVLGPGLWSRYDTGDNLLFTAADFQYPAASPLMRELWQADHPALRKLVGKLALACGQPIPQTPWLDELAAELDTLLTAEETAAITGLLGSGGSPAPESAVSLTPLAEAFTLDEELAPKPSPRASLQPLAPVVVHDLDDEPDELPSRRPKKQAKPEAEPEPVRNFPMWPLVIAAGFLLLACGVAAGIVIAGQINKRETAQPLPEDSPPPPSTPPAPTPPDAQPPAPKPPELPPQPPVALGPPRFEQVWAKPSGDIRKDVRLFFSPDGKTVLVSTGGKTEVLDAKTGNLRTELRGPSLPTFVQHVWWLDRDRVAVFGFPLRAPGLWDAKTGAPLPPLIERDTLLPPPPGLQPTAIQCQLSPNGRYLFAGYPGLFRQSSYTPAPYRVLEFATGKTVAQGEWVLGAVQFTADSSRLLMTETNGRIRWVKLPSGETETEWAFQRNAFPRMISGMSADGALFVYYGKPPGLPIDTYLVDGKTGRVLRKLGVGFGGERITLTADGKWIVGVVNDPTNLRQLAILLTDARTGEILVQTPLHCGLNDIQRVSIAPDGKSLILHNRQKGEIIAYELRGTAPPEATAQAPAPPGPIPPRVPAGLGGGPDLPPPPPPPPPPPGGGLPPAPVLKARWSVATEAGIMPNGLPQALLCSKDGQTIILSAGVTGMILTFSTKTGAAGATYEGHKGPGGVAWLFPFGDNKVVSGGFDAKQATWETKTGKRIDEVKFPDLPPMPNGARGHAGIMHAVSPSGRYTAMARKESLHPVIPGPLRLLDTTTGKEVLKADWNGGRVLFTADESRVFVLNGLGKATWYKLPSGEADGEWATGAGIQAEMARVLGMTADGRTMLYHGPLADQPTGVYLLDARTGQVVRKISGAPYQAAWSTLSPDGKYAVMSVIDFAGGNTWYLDVFEVATWRLVGRIAPPDKRARGPQQFSFTPDGKELAVYDPGTKELSIYPLP